LHPFLVGYEDASTVKWTTLDLCQGLSECHSNFHTNFDFFEQVFEKKKSWFTKPSNLCCQK
jgi:hypothetical protein